MQSYNPFNDPGQGQLLKEYLQNNIWQYHAIWPTHF